MNSRLISPEPLTLDPICFPLHGSRLIEASAGTGKTWTIAALYVRLVLGHGDDLAYARALTPPEILVVTFTEAATQELRDRIRSRLSEAASFFMALPSDMDQVSSEPFLQELRDSYPVDTWPMCARKLQLAAEWMDEAAVSTIHGWCNRMLREHAFDSNSLFSLTLETDPSELQAEVARDYWRTFIVTLDATLAAELRTWWAGPTDLQQTVQNLISHADLLDLAEPPSQQLNQIQANRLALLQQLKEPWLVWVQELTDLLDKAVTNKCVDGRKIQPRYYLPWLAALREWAENTDFYQPQLSDSAWNRLGPDGLSEAWKQGDPPDHEAIRAIPELRLALQNLPCGRNDVLRHAARWMAQRFATEQARHATMGFNDLLTGLDHALQGENGIRLAATIREQFPVVLIDEFQDTDPVQYRIFDSIYRVADNANDTGVILIGDPKQAIYAFRGADIYTYLQARQASAGRLYTLKKNFRSTASMVAAVNRCFEFAEQREAGPGAFLFRDHDSNPLPFVSAQAQGREQVFIVDGKPQTALTLWQAESNQTTLTKAQAQAQMATACASEITRLLNLSHTGHAGFQEACGLKALRPADIAVLVNNRTEAQAVRSALTTLGVGSVYLSDQDSVLQSALASEMYYWLTACADPDDGRQLRAALATPTLGLDWADLDSLNSDEILWEERVLQFRAYRECWRKQGVLPMLRRLLHDFHVPARLLGNLCNSGSTNGERVLTDILHLAEWLQHASGLLEGEHALIRYFLEQQQTLTGTRGNDALQIRLESDADLIKVVTVHKSKGLEYPLVFLPFAWNFRQVKADDIPLKYHDDQGSLQLALSSTQEILQKADQERLGEDLRKLYVGLTRARYATWLGTAPLPDQNNSSMGSLLGLTSPVTPDSLKHALNSLGTDTESIAMAPLPDQHSIALQEPVSLETQGAARQPERSVREQWWIASYSSLAARQMASISGEDPSPATPDQELFDEAIAAAMLPMQVWPEPSDALGSAVLSFGLLHNFPKGPGPGSFLHDVLEWAATLGFEQLANQPDQVRDVIARRCQLRGWEAWIDPLTLWLQDFATTRFRLGSDHGMTDTTVSLANLDACSIEMEFWLSADTVQIQQLDQLIGQYSLPGQERAALQPGLLNGMLKGFIDLVFLHEGRYYVADYKSNFLGENDASYTHDAMQNAVLQHRYDLQYVLYLLALHRLLKSRLPDYDYDLHIGGAVYFFLRGLQAPSQGLHTERPPRELIIALDHLFSSAHDTELA
ncbi:exodeoxyribonuclease V subunit beta [Alcaligenaceae bacterium]|nr:exodeoxyribonuclease V subunit beta [Alcaligenaceae bacterium]